MTQTDPFHLSRFITLSGKKALSHWGFSIESVNIIGFKNLLQALGVNRYRVQCLFKVCELQKVRARNENNNNKPNVATR